MKTFFKQKKSLLNLMVMFMIVFMFGCGAKYSKSNLHYEITSKDFVKVNKTFPKCGRWDNCYKISENEFRQTLRQAYRDCYNKIKDNYPKLLTYSERKSLIKNWDKCAKIKFLSINKEKFTFDKTPECLDQCENIQNYSEKLR